MSGRGLTWYKRDPIRFLDGVQGMGPEHIGAYAVLLDLIYARDGEIRRDDRHLSGVLGCSVRKARALTDALIEAGKITVRGEKLTQKVAETSVKQSRTERETKANAQRKRRENEAASSKNSDLEDKPECTKPPREEKIREDKRKRDTDVSPKKRATRLPEDWTLPKPYGDWAVSEGWPETVIREQADRFKDYWISKAGKDAAKLDWLATWRNWMRNSGAPKMINGGQDGNATGNPRLSQARGNRPDPALEQIARLAGLGGTPGDAGG